MKTPDRFVLAFPFEGNKYIHYKCYWVDFGSGVIVRTRSKHDYNVCGLSFHMEWPNRSDEVLRRRIAGKPKLKHDRMFITDGFLRNTHWRLGRHDFLKEENNNDDYAVRFQPIPVNFASFCVTGEPLKNEKDFCELEDRVDGVIRKLCNDDRLWYSDGRCVLTIKPEMIGKVVDALTEAFHFMSFSQIVLSLKSQYKDYSRTSQLFDVYDREIPKYLSETFIANLNLVYPPKALATPKTLKELKARCAARFIRRHPNAATSNLLKMLAMKFKTP